MVGEEVALSCEVELIKAEQKDLTMELVPAEEKKVVV
jgi:hypothetical protein